MSHPFALMTVVIRLSIMPIKYLQISSDISRIQTNLIASFGSGIYGGCFSATLFLRRIQKFSVALRWELFPGHFRKVTLLAPKKFVTMFE